jgi:hypothetical protein
MTIDSFFKNENYSDIIFDPTPSYDGDWIFSAKNLIKNSKRDKGINLFEEYYNNTYIKPLSKYFKHIKAIKSSVGFISSPNKDGYGRCLKYNKIDFFMSMNAFLDFTIDKVGKTDEEQQAYLKSLINLLSRDNQTINEGYAKALEEKKKRLEDVIDNGFSSIYFDAARIDYETFAQGRVDFSKYLNVMKEIVDDYAKGLLLLGDFFEEPLDYNKLYECFEPDTFYLLFATIIYEINKIREDEDNSLDNSYIYLYNYFDKMKEISKVDKRYDPYVLYTWNAGNIDNEKNERVSRRALQIKYDEMMNRHPECKPLIIPNMSDVDKLKDIKLVEKLKQLYDSSIEASWEFLPSGEGIKKGIVSSNQNRSENDNTELLEEVNSRIEILEKSAYIKCIKGKNTFDGYYAFVYANGIIILEKFWNNELNGIPASKHNATYVMNIDNFLELSKLSRTSLVEYIKTLPEVGVKRIFHTSIDNWHKNILEEIEGSYRLEDAIDFINRIQKGDLRHE